MKNDGLNNAFYLIILCIFAIWIEQCKFTGDLIVVVKEKVRSIYSLAPHLGIARQDMPHREALRAGCEQIVREHAACLASFSGELGVGVFLGERWIYAPHLLCLLIDSHVYLLQINIDDSIILV